MGLGYQTIHGNGLVSSGTFELQRQRLGRGEAVGRGWGRGGRCWPVWERRADQAETDGGQRGEGSNGRVRLGACRQRWRLRTVEPDLDSRGGVDVEGVRRDEAVAEALGQATAEVAEAAEDPFAVAAQQAAAEAGHAQIGPLHLLSTLLDQEGGLVAPLLEKVGVPADRIRSVVHSELSRLPVQSQQAGMAMRGFPKAVGKKDRKEFGTGGGGWMYNRKGREPRRELWSLCDMFGFSSR